MYAEVAAYTSGPVICTVCFLSSSKPLKEIIDCSDCERTRRSLELQELPRDRYDIQSLVLTWKNHMVNKPLNEGKPSLYFTCSLWRIVVPARSFGSFEPLLIEALEIIESKKCMSAGADASDSCELLTYETRALCQQLKGR